MVICVGYDLVEFGPAGWNPKMLKRIVHVDARPAEVDGDYIPEVEIVARRARRPCEALREELPAGPAAALRRPACAWRSPPSCAPRPSARVS